MRSLQAPEQRHQTPSPLPPAWCRGWQCSYSGGSKWWGAQRMGWGGRRGCRVLGGVRHSAPLLCEPRGAPQSARAPTLQPLCVNFIHLHGTHPEVLTGALMLPYPGSHYCSGHNPLLRPRPPLRLSLAWFPVPNCTLWAASRHCRHTPPVRGSSVLRSRSPHYHTYTPSLPHPRPLTWRKTKSRARQSRQ